MKMNKKGITLVEVIVVLLIMGILAGIVVTTYTGYLDRAHEQTAMVEARAVYLAALTLYNEKYAESTEFDEELDTTEVTTLAGVTGTLNSITVEDGKVTAAEYKASNKIVLKYTVADGWKKAE